MARRRSRRKIRFGDAGLARSEWAMQHEGFPWYGIHWGWHVFLIWPAAVWTIAKLVYIPFIVARMAAREPAG